MKQHFVFFIALFIGFGTINGQNLERYADSLDSLKNAKSSAHTKLTANSDYCTDSCKIHLESWHIARYQNLILKEEYGKAQYDFDKKALLHASDVFEWQLFSAKFIFSIVILIVGLGLFFSGYHFYHHVQILTGKIKLNKSKSGSANSDTSIEAGPGGIKLNSSLIGVVILTLSLAFFFLYLQYVFPVNQTNFSSDTVKEAVNTVAK